MEEWCEYMKAPKSKHIFKTIVVGDAAVGKTSLTIRFSEDKFDPDYKMTIGVSFATKTVDANGKSVKLSIWDTAGQERFSFLLPTYYKGAGGALLVFDVTRRATFERLPQWVDHLVKNCGEIPPFPVILVANKTDLEEARDVSTEEAKAFSEENGIQYFEASAKTGAKVKDVFEELAKLMLETIYG